jgi:hypothetical protein
MTITHSTNQFIGFVKCSYVPTSEIYANDGHDGNTYHLLLVLSHSFSLSLTLSYFLASIEKETFSQQ